MSGSNPLAAVAAGIPAVPNGYELAAYATYLEAQRAVDHLSDEGFPVQELSIVGSDLRSVERVTGRLTYPKVALAGAVSGAWFGVFAGLLLSLFSTGAGGGAWFGAVLIGAAFGILFAIVRYALTGGRRDFSSVSAVLATRYTVICTGPDVGRARQLLSGLEGVRPLPASSSGAASPGPSAPGGPSSPAEQSPPLRQPPTQPPYGGSSAL